MGKERRGKEVEREREGKGGGGEESEITLIMHIVIEGDAFLLNQYK